MSYLVLARKYRPRRLDEIVGQELTTGTLRGAIEEGRIGHAYLFAGPRGTGKTTAARALAKGLNCEQGPTAEPCGTCERCLAADAGAEADIVEIDAATHTGVDHVRDLRDQAAYMPMRARFKVYIIDEVHMLSRPAFNALLKTLEEPPPHVKFFFATTELHKVPDTIRSRCQVLRLEPIAEPVIAARLSYVFGAEGVEAEPGVVEELARRARGGMRDALSLADQLLALVGERPALSDVDRLASDGSGRDVERLLACVEAGDKAGALAALPAAHGGASGFLELLLDHVRAALGAALSGPSRAQPLAADGDPAATERGIRLGVERLELWLEELLFARQRMQNLPGHARLVLEGALLKLCDRSQTIPLAELVERLAALERRLAGGAEPASAAAAQSEPRPARAPAAAPSPSPSPPEAPPARAPVRPAPPERAPPRAAADAAQPSAAPRTGQTASARRASRTGDVWAQFLALLEQRSPSVAEVLRARGKLVEHVPGRAVVKLTRLSDEERALALEPRNARACTKAFSELMGEDVDVVLEDASSTPPGHTDEFTRDVAGLFDGRHEDER